jgi:hypothetical protein
LVNSDGYLKIIQTMKAAIADFGAGINNFSTSGTCEDAEVTSNGNTVTGCCNI